MPRLFGTDQGAAGKPACPTHRKPAFMTACVPGGHARLPSFALTGGLPPVVAAFLLLPGRPGALLRPAPLRTGRASFPASGSSKPYGFVGVPQFGAEAVSALGVYETGSSRLRAAWPRRGRDDSGAGGQPLLPIARGLWLVLDGE